MGDRRCVWTRESSGNKWSSQDTEIFRAHVHLSTQSICIESSLEPKEVPNKLWVPDSSSNHLFILPKGQRQKGTG